MEELDQFYPLVKEEELVKHSKLFQRELLAALHNQQSSLPSILNPIHQMTAKAGFGVVVAVGGTNGYVSSFRVSAKGVITFLNRRMFSLPEQTPTDNGCKLARRPERPLFYNLSRNRSAEALFTVLKEIGRASCRERVCQYV